MAKLSARGCAVHVGEDAQAQALRGRRLADLGEDDHAALAPRRHSICRTMRTDAGMNPRRCATGGGSPSESANGPARVARAVLVRRERGVRERGRTGRNLGSEARKGPLAGSLIERTPGFQCGLRRRIDLSRACCSALRGGRLPFSISTASKWSGPSRFPSGLALTSRGMSSSASASRLLVFKTRASDSTAPKRPMPPPRGRGTRPTITAKASAEDDFA